VSCFRVAVFLGLIVLSSCKDYHKDMLEWAESIPAASSLGFVKSSTPGYLEIDWNNPHQVDKGITRYTITAIQGHQDPVSIHFYLEFKNGIFSRQGWERLE